MLVSNTELEYLCYKLKSTVNKEYLYISNILELLYITGCRGQEAIKTNFWEVSANQYIILHPQKNNNMRLFDRNIFSESTINYLQITPHFDNLTSYKRLNYFINQNISHLGISLFNKKIVTHLFRHNYVRKLIQQGLQPIEIQQLMGHLEVGTTERYFNSPIESQLNILDNI